MNWEYQVFYRGPIRGIEMSLTGNKLIVGLACENRKDIVSTLSRVPFVNGYVFLTTLNIVPELTSDRPQSAPELFYRLIAEIQFPKKWI